MNPMNPPNPPDTGAHGSPAAPVAAHAPNAVRTPGTSKTLLVPYYEHPSVRPAEWDALIAAAPGVYGVVLNPQERGAALYCAVPGAGDHP